MIMNVIHIITHFDQGGAERVAVNIAKSCTQDFQYHIVEVAKTSGTFRNDFLKECKKNNIIAHKSFVRSNKLAILLFPFWFLWFVIKNRPDIIHSHTEVPDLSLYLWATLFGWMFPKLKFIRTIHNTELWNNWKRIGLKVENFFKKSNANIAISAATRDCYCAAYGESPDIIYNGLSEVVQKPFKNIVKGKVNVLFAGRFEYQKGVDQLCDVVELLKDNQQIVFHIVGNGSLQYKIDRLKSLPNVCLYSKIYGLSQYLKSFDYLFMPSNHEGLALMPIEASLAKVPSIINSCPGLKDTLPIDWPLSVQNNSVEQFVKIFNDLDKYDSKALGEAAYSFAKHNFAIEIMQSKYEQVYRKLLQDC